MFQWIEDHHLIHLIMNRVFDLFRLNSKQAASLLVNHMTEITVIIFLL